MRSALALAGLARAAVIVSPSALLQSESDRDRETVNVRSATVARGGTAVLVGEDFSVLWNDGNGRFRTDEYDRRPGRKEDGHGSKSTYDGHDEDRFDDWVGVWVVVGCYG